NPHQALLERQSGDDVQQNHDRRDGYENKERAAEPRWGFGEEAEGCARIAGMHDVHESVDDGNRLVKIDRLANQELRRLIGDENDGPDGEGSGESPGESVSGTDVKGH